MSGSYNGVAVPADGKAISYSNGKYQVPDNPIIPFIEGDGTGRDIWKASLRVFNAAVEKAYKGKRRVAWYEVFAGEKAKAKFGFCGSFKVLPARCFSKSSASRESSRILRTAGSPRALAFSKWSIPCAALASPLSL